MNSWQRFFSHSVGCLLILVISFDVQKIFNLSILALFPGQLEPYSKKYLFMSISSLFFPNSFKVWESY
jgi:hypothetical protein